MEFPCSQSTVARKGRKEKSFIECCDRAKRYKAAAVASQFPKEQLEMASDMQGGGNRGKSYIDPSVALAILLNADLTKFQYETIKIALSSEGFDILPPYKKVLEEKKMLSRRIGNYRNVCCCSSAKFAGSHIKAPF